MRTLKIRKEKNFISLFDEKTGHYLRTGIIENDRETGADPFAASFPELLDVGIMGHCIHGQAGLCIKAGIECYQGGSYKKNSNMALADFESSVREKHISLHLAAAGTQISMSISEKSLKFAV